MIYHRLCGKILPGSWKHQQTDVQLLKQRSEDSLAACKPKLGNRKPEPSCYTFTLQQSYAVALLVMTPSYVAFICPEYTPQEA